jgi:hypothetical protein
MALEEAYTRLLTDEELRPRLERSEAIVFPGLSREWQQIERQVEKLGFGELYFVTQRSGPRGGAVRLSPAQTAPLNIR